MNWGNKADCSKDWRNNVDLAKSWSLNDKVFSTRSYQSPSSCKKLKEIDFRKENNSSVWSKTETELIQFLVYLENKGIPAINIFKEEFYPVSERKLTTISDLKANEIKRELFNEDSLSRQQFNQNSIFAKEKRDKYTYPPIVSLHESNSKKHIKMNKQNWILKPKNNSIIHPQSNNKSINKQDDIKNSDKLSFRSEDSYKPIWSGSPVKLEKPSWVPVLDLTHLFRKFYSPPPPPWGSIFEKN